MAELVRVARDQSAVILESEGWFSVVNKDNTLGETSDNLATLLASGSWRRPVESDVSKYVGMTTALTSNTSPNRKLRLPKKIAKALGKEFITLSEATQLLAKQQSVLHSLDELGGEEGWKWVNSVVNSPEPLTAAGAFEPSEELVYLATSNQPDTTQIDSLFAVTEDNTLLRWVGKRFDEVPMTPEELDEPTILEVDSETARAIADWVEDGELGGYIDIAELDAEEAALVNLAVSEIDWEIYDHMEAIVAAAFYDNFKREIHAERQERAPDGKFNGPQHEPGKKLTFVRARVPEYYSILEDPASRVQAYFSSVKGTPVLLAAGDMPSTIPEDAQETVPGTAPTEEVPEETQSAETEPLYMAIVDDVDRTAVLNIVAIIKDDTGTETSWIRQNGMWVPDPKYLEQIRSDAPPTVVELTDAETIKDVLRQIDASDSEEEAPTEEEAPPAEEEPVAASGMDEFRDFSPERRKKLAQQGYAMPSGAYPIVTEEDLRNAIQAYGRAAPGEKDAVRRHIRKRAKALGRADLLPETWKANAVADTLAYYEDMHRLYDDFGYPLLAAGVPGIADTPKDWAAVQRLRNYWMFGRGAAKIRWGTPGDLTRCHRHLSKYMPGRAWGYCQERHKDIFGIPNPESGRRG